MILSCLPSSYKDQIEFDNPKTLEETMRKAKLCFEQYINRNENSRNWNGKKFERFDPKKKHGAYSNKNANKRFQGGNKFRVSEPFNQLENKGTKPRTFFNKEISQKETVKCWECGGSHYYKYCPLRGNNNVKTIQEATTVGEQARSTPKNNASLENRQVDHQTSIVEIEGMIHNQPIIVLIDPGASLSYISVRVVEICKLHK